MQGLPVPTTVTPIHTVHPDMPLSTALNMLMEAGVSSLPVVDRDGVLLDIYARSDITLLTRGSAYLQLQVRPHTHALHACRRRRAARAPHPAPLCRWRTCRCGRRCSSQARA
jgi:CBS domain